MHFHDKLKFLFRKKLSEQSFVFVFNVYLHFKRNIQRCFAFNSTMKTIQNVRYLLIYFFLPKMSLFKVMDNAPDILYTSFL